MIRLTEAEAAALMTGKKPRKAKKEKKPLVAPQFELRVGTEQFPTMLIIPLEIVSEANRARGHWAPTYSRKGTQRKTIQKALARNIYGLIRFVVRLNENQPIHVRLTRIAPGTLDEANLWSGMKTPEDTIAEWMGTNDRPPLWNCTVAQEKSKEYGLKVEIWT